MIALRMHVILRNAIDYLMVFVIMFEIFVYIIPFDVIYIKSNNKIPNTANRFNGATLLRKDNLQKLPVLIQTIASSWVFQANTAPYPNIGNIREVANKTSALYLLSVHLPLKEFLIE